MDPNSLGPGCAQMIEKLGQLQGRIQGGSWGSKDPPLPGSYWESIKSGVVA